LRVKNVSIKNINVHNYFIGINLAISDTLLVDGLNILRDTVAGNLDSTGIFAIQTLNISIKNANIHNYFVGINLSSANTLSIEDVNILRDNTFNNFGNIGIAAQQTSSMSVKNANMHNYYRGIVCSQSDAVLIEYVNILANNAFDSQVNRGIDAVLCENLIIKYVNIHNYYQGISVGTADSVIIKKINILIDAPIVINNVDNYGIFASFECKNLIIKYVNIHNYFQGIDISNSPMILVDHVNIDLDTQFTNLVAIFQDAISVTNFGQMKNASIKNVNIHNYFTGIDIFVNVPTINLYNTIIIQNVTIKNDSILTILNVVNNYIPQTGIRTNGLQNGLFDNVAINTAYNGINVSRSSDIRCNKLVINNVHSGVTSEGIVEVYCNGITIENSTISGATFLAPDTGFAGAAVDFAGAISSEVKDSNIYGNINGIAIRNGVRLINDVLTDVVSESIKITNNNISQNSIYGIGLSGDTNATCIVNNCISHNDFYGIILGAFPLNNIDSTCIANNCISRNGTGLFLNNNTIFTVLRDNTFMNNIEQIDPAPATPQFLLGGNFSANNVLAPPGIVV
jgi:hypothetical protein